MQTNHANMLLQVGAIYWRLGAARYLQLSVRYTFLPPWDVQHSSVHASCPI